MTATTKIDALKELRRRSKNRYGESKIVEDGIALEIRFRYQASFREFNALVLAAGGDVFTACKTGKATSGSSTPWLLVFTIDIPEDSYIAGRISLETAREWMVNRDQRNQAMFGGTEPCSTCWNDTAEGGAAHGCPACQDEVAS